MRSPVLVGSTAVTVLVLGFLVRAVAIEKCVSVRVSNCYSRTVTVAHGPVTLCAEARVVPDARHRYLETVWDYSPSDPTVRPEIPMNSARPRDFIDDFDTDGTHESEPQNGAIGSSLRSLDGEQERIRQDVKLHHLEGGTYEVRATVYTDEARKKVCGRATTRVTVR